MEDQVPQPAARTCSKHGVVLDPFGQCVICRREMADDEADPTGIRAAATLLVALGLAVAGVFFWKGTHVKPAPPVAPSTFVPPTPAAVIDEASVEEEDRAAKAQARETQERREAVQRQMKEVPITMYSTKWCELCKTAATFFQGKGYAYKELDVEADPQALAAMTKLNPKNSVPTLVVGEEVIVGFGQGAVIGAIYRSAVKNVR